MQLRGVNTLLGIEEGAFDGHVHLFRTSLPLAPERRYAPEVDARLEALAPLLECAGLRGALVVQPSFLGTDNTHLLEILDQTRDHPRLTFRGVVVAEPTIPDQGLRAMDARGVVGLRLNLLKRPIPDLTADSWIALLRKADCLNWHVEVQIEGRRLALVLPILLRHCSRVVIDHFGLPDHGDIDRCSGFRLLTARPREALFVKLSGPYRAFRARQSEVSAQKAAPAYARLYDCFGPERMIWGSDWPWTQFEGRHAYRETLTWLHDWEAKRREGLETPAPGRLVAG